jgi:hypothetical protein
VAAARDASVAQLIARLAVLRRPQTPADVVPTTRLLGPRRGARTLPGLTRLVAIEPGTRLFLVVTTPAGGSPPLWNPRLGDQVTIVAVTSGGSAESVGFPAVDLADADQVLEAGVFAPSRPVEDSVYNVSIVPDGVARVRWGFVTPAGKPGRVVDVPVANNVAVSPLRRGTGVLGRATWYASDGSVVPTSDRALRHAFAVREAVLTARAARYDARHSYHAPAALPADFAVFAFTSRTGVRTRGATSSPTRGLPQCRCRSWGWHRPTGWSLTRWLCVRSSRRPGCGCGSPPAGTACASARSTASASPEGR